MTLWRNLTLALLSAGTLMAQRVGQPTDDLTSLSIDDLFSVEITSVGKKAQQLSKAPAAVHVLTSEDILRSGATSIPEALQWMPGLTVYNINGHDWMVSARGSTRLYSDKILVMVDGRSLYTPLFSGVLWEYVDVPLEDVERIEVVLGPGAVMWGPNAVNGVINIITKSTTATKGGELSARTGNELHGSLLARWGGSLGSRVTYRVWGKADQENPAFSSPGYFYIGSAIPNPTPVTNLESQSGGLGFRVDAAATPKDQFTAQGDFHKIGGQAEIGFPDPLFGGFQTLQGHTGYQGGSLLGAWTHTKSSEDEATLQFSFDKYDIDYNFLNTPVTNWTVEYQRRQQTGESNEVFWGGGYQQYSDATTEHYFAGFKPSNGLYRDSYVVFRDELQLVPGKLLLSAGSRVDYNSWTRFEFQPSIRLLYTPTSKQSLWLAASRAIRTPSRYDRDLQVSLVEQIGGEAVPLEETGSHQRRSEIERSLEAGYRLQSGRHWSVDASVFWSFYNKLSAVQVSLDPVIVMVGQTPVSAFIAPLGNYGTGRTFGGEISATWQVRPRWKIIPSYSYLNEVRWLPDTPGSLLAWDDALADPRHQGLLRSQYDLSRNWKLDLGTRLKSRNMGYNVGGAMLVDAQVSWRASRSSSFSFSVHNLLNHQTLETYPELPFIAIPLRRTMTLSWRQTF